MSELFRADEQIAFIGSGIMAEAMIAGLLSKNIVLPKQILATDTLASRRADLESQYGIRSTSNNKEAAQSDILILSIKPQVAEKVYADLHTQTNPPKLVVSIMAGVHIEQISAGLGNPCIVRSMPNTPARIGQGITVWTATKQVETAQLEQARAILQSFGQEIYVEDENYLDMATALSGTGPAYVFMFMEAMIDAGVHMGFSRRIAEQLVMQTMRGSVEYAAVSREHPATLRNQVTSPGGTSAEAIYHLEKGGLRTVLARAIWAAYQRSVSLGVKKSVGNTRTDAPDSLDK
jgi:pyrroline-5-carboxylate reductase